MNLKQLRPGRGRTRDTRRKIGDALLHLMQTTPFEQISVSDICKQAEISRVTYYTYFYTKADALKNYAREILTHFLLSAPYELTAENICDRQNLAGTIRYFIRYEGFVLTLIKAGLYHFLLDTVNDYLLEHVVPQYRGSRYELYFVAGACLNVFMKWLEEGKQETVEEMAEVLAGTLSPLCRA